WVVSPGVGLAGPGCECPRTARAGECRRNLHLLLLLHGPCGIRPSAPNPWRGEYERLLWECRSLVPYAGSSALAGFQQRSLLTCSHVVLIAGGAWHAFIVMRSEHNIES